jgi:hypothetical protein
VQLILDRRQRTQEAFGLAVQVDVDVHGGFASHRARRWHRP